MIEKLKPCPFCGGEKLKIDNKTVLDGYSGNGIRINRSTYSVRCNSCHARGGAVGGKVKPYWIEDNRLPKVNLFTEDELKEKAVEMWNNRKQ